MYKDKAGKDGWREREICLEYCLLQFNNKNE
jgi:hypothetical protein